jgi:hypothetical protein
MVKFQSRGTENETSTGRDPETFCGDAGTPMRRLKSQLIAEMLELDSVTNAASTLKSGDVTGNRAKERWLCLFDALEIWITASVGERINDIE